AQHLVKCGWKSYHVTLHHQRAHDALFDPANGVGREIEPPLGVEALDAFHQAEVALLNEILKCQTPVLELLGDMDHQLQITLNQRGEEGIASFGARPKLPNMVSKLIDSQAAHRFQLPDRTDPAFEVRCGLTLGRNDAT